MKSKIGRVLANASFLESFPNAFVHFKTLGFLSDNSPALVNLMPHTGSSSFMFKYFNIWSDNPCFNPVPSQSWRVSVPGTVMFRLCKKPKALKHLLKALN